MYTLRAAWRSLIRRPVASAVIVATAGFAVAGNAALFAVINALLFRPLPYPNADRIVHLEAPVHRFLSKPELAGLVMETARTTPRLVSRCVIKVESPFQPGSPAVLEWQLRVAAVSAGCFDLFGQKAILGRPFSADEGRRSPRPLLISERIWRSRFGSDPAIINRVVDIPVTFDDQKWVIVGVMPAAFAATYSANACALASG
jgi:hypothetical protein